MRWSWFLISTLMALAAPSAAGDAGDAHHPLLGTWRVDLRPTPDAEPYYQEFIVRAVDGGTFTGSFYGTEIQDGRINPDWGSLRFAFVTSDGSGDYHSAGILEADTLSGTTHSRGRGFLAVWTAKRVE